jgi:hypothetical protein
VSETTVTVVLDGEFGERIREFDPASLWFVDSATNLDALQLVRRSDPEFRPTTFRDSPGRSREEVLRGVLSTVELHHGRYSQDPPYDHLVVYGARPNHEVRATLEEIGFRVDSPTAEGFTASRAPSA